MNVEFFLSVHEVQIPIDSIDFIFLHSFIIYIMENITKKNSRTICSIYRVIYDVVVIDMICILWNKENECVSSIASLFLFFCSSNSYRLVIFILIEFQSSFQSVPLKIFFAFFSLRCYLSYDLLQFSKGILSWKSYSNALFLCIFNNFARRAACRVDYIMRMNFFFVVLIRSLWIFEFLLFLPCSLSIPFSMRSSHTRKKYKIN